MSFRVVEIQPTPNPNAVKFVLDREVATSPMSFFNEASAKDHPIAARLFQIAGVTSLLLLGDFVTVNKRPDVQWSSLKTKIKNALAEAE